MSPLIFRSDLNYSQRDKFACLCRDLTTVLSGFTIPALAMKPCVVMENIRQGETSQMRAEISTIRKKSSYRKSHISDNFTPP